MRRSRFKQLLRMLAGWALLRAAAHAPAPATACPACGVLAGKLELLTASDAYYCCGQCPHRWSSGRRRAFA
jgi:hypothetical protein